MQHTRVEPDLDLAYRISGPERAGDPLMFLAPLARDHSALASLVAPFANERRCIEFDYRGTGFSSEPPGSYACDLLARDAEALLTHLDIPSVHVIGVSMGAAVGLELALHKPDVVTSLVLVTPWATTDDALRQVFSGLRNEAATGSIRRLERRVADLVFSDSFLRAKAGLAPEIDEMLSSPSYPSRRAIVAHFEAAIAHDVRNRLDEVRCASLVIAGEDDTFIPPSYAREIHGRIAGCRLSMLVGEGSSHGLTVERPTEVIRTTRDFLRSL